MFDDCYHLVIVQTLLLLQLNNRLVLAQWNGIDSLGHISKPAGTCTMLYKPVQACTSLTVTQESLPFTVLSQGLTIYTNVTVCAFVQTIHMIHVV